MDNNIVRTVYQTLKDGTERIGKSVAELNALEAEIRANRYSTQTMKNEIYPKCDSLRAKIRDGKADVIRAAKAHVAQYRQDVEKMNDLNPDELTSDLQLLQGGIPLTSRDILAIVERNKNNRTMLQIALRIAAERGIDVHGTFFIGGEAERENAKNLDALIDLYSERIGQDNAAELLDRFFNMGG